MTRRLLPLSAAFLAACSDGGTVSGMEDTAARGPSVSAPEAAAPAPAAPATTETAEASSDPYAGLPDFQGPAALQACDLEAGGQTYRGPCYVVGDDGGGVNAVAPNAVGEGDGIFFGDVHYVSAGPDRDGGYGYTMTRSGEEAEFRTTGDIGGDCWTGEGFRLCATDPGTEPALPDTGPVAGMRRAESYAATAMATYREPGPNTLFADAVYGALPDRDGRGARLVRCSVSTPGEYYRGPCYFLAESTGGFSLYRPDAGELVPGTTIVSLGKTSSERGDIRGLTTDGISSRWGEAERSDADPACWGGADFEVCANSL